MHRCARLLYGGNKEVNIPIVGHVQCPHRRRTNTKTTKVDFASIVAPQHSKIRRNAKPRILVYNRNAKLPILRERKYKLVSLFESIKEWITPLNASGITQPAVFLSSSILAFQDKLDASCPRLKCAAHKKKNRTASGRVLRTHLSSLASLAHHPVREHHRVVDPVWSHEPSTRRAIVAMLSVTCFNVRNVRRMVVPPVLCSIHACLNRQHWSATLRKFSAKTETDA